MAIEVTVPRLGWSMDEGTLAEWLKSDGDFMHKGDMLFVLEGEKATQEIESFDEGILRFLPDGPKPGDAVRVGQVVALLVAKDEATNDAPPTMHSLETSPTSRLTKGSRRSRFDGAHTAGGPAARRQARIEARQSDATLLPSQPPRRRAPKRVRATPRARRRANELGIDLTLIAGSGRDGRVRECDVLAAAKKHSCESLVTENLTLRRVPHSTVRRTIAERMVASRQATAAVTLSSTVDASNLVALRQEFKSAVRDASAIVPSYADFVVKLAALALVEHPALNSCWQDDCILEFSDVHIGIAVDTEHGLLVPVIRDAHRLGLRAIAAQARDLELRARERQLSAQQMQGGTFTLSNLGAYGIDAFTPIINGSQCAILGMGRIRKQPWVVDDKIVLRDILTLSLTFDHRIVDGGPAARFLQTVCRGVEHPAERLIV